MDFVLGCRAIYSDGKQVDWRHLQIGSTLPLYGKIYAIIGVDDATRKFFESEGFRLPANMEYPEGPYDKAQKKAKEVDAAMKSRPGESGVHFVHANRSAYNRFLSLDGKVRGRA